jgi:excisionase family DNA binding protein
MSNSNQSKGGPEALWAATDVAKYLNVSRSWVYQRAEAGELPSLRMGGLLRFDPEAVRSYARGEGPKGARILPFRPPGGGRQ